MELEIVLQLIFWFSLICIVLIYFGYPAFVYIYSGIVSRRPAKTDIEPRVSIIIAARNEAASIERKIENTFALRYPKEKMEVLVVSDASADSTDKIVDSLRRRFGDALKLIRQETRLGKTAAQNLGVAHANGEIYVFSDATTIYDENALLALVRNFADDKVGCVGGSLRYSDKDTTGIGSGTIHYWNYETFLKSRESLLGSLIGVSGCIYAVRASAYDALYETACSDFVIALEMRRKGLRTIFEPDAVAFEVTNKAPGDELNTRIRIAAQTLYDIKINKDLLNPFVHGWFAFQLLAHKLLRYFIPALLLLLFVSSGILAFKSNLYFAALIAQLVFYFLGLLGWYFESRGIRVSMLSVPLYFLLANVAFAGGFIRFVRGDSYSLWEPLRDST